MTAGSGIEFDGFDEESVRFTLRGLPAMRLAKELGSAAGYEPCTRTYAEVTVTLYHEPLTENECFHKFHSDSGDAGSQPELFG